MSSVWAKSVAIFVIWVKSNRAMQVFLFWSDFTHEWFWIYENIPSLNRIEIDVIIQQLNEFV